MLFYVIFQYWFTLGRRVLAFTHAWIPSYHLVRWIGTDRGARWGLPIGVALTSLYYLAMTWSGEHLHAGGIEWWWVPTVWGSINTVKFAYVAIRSPFVWLQRSVRRRTDPWRETFSARPAGLGEPTRRPPGRCDEGSSA